MPEPALEKHVRPLHPIFIIAGSSFDYLIRYVFQLSLWKIVLSTDGHRFTQMMLDFAPDRRARWSTLMAVIQLKFSPIN